VAWKENKVETLDRLARVIVEVTRILNVVCGSLKAVCCPCSQSNTNFTKIKRGFHNSSIAKLVVCMTYRGHGRPLGFAKREDSMLQALQLIATFAAVLFAGAALYIQVAEHPARMELETRMAALQWAPSYRRATLLQAPLALVSFLTGLVAWLMGANRWWLVAALFIGAVVPFTLVVVMPTNHKLLEPSRDLAATDTRQLLEKWGKLHTVRTILSLTASVIYLWLLSEA
jgi:uncharacterized membrane protein